MGAVPALFFANDIVADVAVIDDCTVALPHPKSDNVMVSVSAHAFVVTLRVRNMTSKRRRDIDKVRNLREEECFLQGGVFADKALDK